MINETKWRFSAPLKSRWYDDDFGDERGHAREIVENRLRALDDRSLKSDEEDVRARVASSFFEQLATRDQS